LAILAKKGNLSELWFDDPDLDCGRPRTQARGRAVVNPQPVLALAGFHP
jgi:hypothetical protein